MKIEDKKADGCRVRLVITAPAEETRGDYDRIADVYRRKASIRGFRPGKAPVAVIEKFYGKELNADVRAALVNKFLDEAIAGEKLDVVARVNVADVLFSKATGVSFTAEVDVRPEFKLPKYQKLPVKFKDVVVADEDVARRLEDLRADMSPREDSPGPSVTGDMVRIDFTTRCQGDRALADVVPSVGRYSSAEDLWMPVSADEEGAVPGLGAALSGKKPGDRVSLDVKFPKDFVVEALRGQKARYDVALKAIRRSKPLDDEALAKNAGFKTIGELRDAVRKRMADDASAAADAAVREQISGILVRKAGFDLPKSIVGMVFERMLDQAIRRATRGQADPRAYAEAHAGELQKEAMDAAERRVRLYYVLEAIAGEQKIEVSDADVQREIDAAARYYAMRYGDKTMTSAKMRANLEHDGTITLLRHDILSDKVLAWMVEDAKSARAAAGK